jgi:hypothetical protein
MEDYVQLGRKLIWVQDHPDPLEGESLPRPHEAITHLSHGGPLFVNLLAPKTPASYPGCATRWPPKMATPGDGNVAPRSQKPAENLAASGGGAGAEQLVAPTEDRLRAQK